MPTGKNEPAVVIKSQNVVWVNGPFPAGSYTDLMTFWSSLKSMLGQSERFIANRKYNEEEDLMLWKTHPNKVLHDVLCARHEPFNGRTKNSKILISSYRHEWDKPCSVFQAIFNISIYWLNRVTLFSTKVIGCELKVKTCYR